MRIEAPNRVVLIDALRQQSRTFECSFAFDSSDPSSPSYADQNAVYQRIGAQMVEHAISGINCCLCAYGQTGTGKTHTVHGDWGNSQQRGLLPRIADGLFKRCAELLSSGALVRLHVSYVEVYNNQLRDLLGSMTVATSDRSAVGEEGSVSSPVLSPARNGGNAAAPREGARLEIHTHPAMGVYVDNLSEHLVRDFRELARLAACGDKAKHTSATSMNSRSSRSHTIFNFKIEINNAHNGDEPGSPGSHHRMATVQVVDLAGRENEQSSECTGDRFRELTFINRSLFELANCVYALGEGREHVPFRNSKLTMLLSESLQRNSRTVILATLTPSQTWYDENLLTCRFLESTSRIMTQPTVNKFCSEDLAPQLQDEIERLRLALSLGGSNAPGGDPLLASRQALLRHINELSWAENVIFNDPESLPGNGRGPGRGSVIGRASVRASSEHAMLARNAVAAGMVRHACDRVGRALHGAENSLGRFEAANSAAVECLGEAESRLEAVEKAIREMVAQLGLPQEKVKKARAKPTLENRLEQQAGPREPKPEEHREPEGATELLASRPASGNVLPPLPIPEQPKSAKPVITFTVSLPPIVFT